MRLDFRGYFNNRSQFDRITDIRDFFTYLAGLGEFTKTEIQSVQKNGRVRVVEKQVPYSIHDKQLKWLELWTQKEEKISLLLASRWKGKTDIVTILFSAWYLYNNPAGRVGVVTKHLTRSNTIIKKIARLLELVGVKTTKDEFGNFWLDKQNLGHTPSLARTYIGQSIRGNRFNVIIFDDMIEDRDEYYPVQLRRAEKHLSESISLTEKIIVVGQLVTKHDIHYKLRNSQDVFLLESWQGDIPEIERPLEEFKNLSQKDIARNFLGYIDDREDAIFLPVQIDDRPMKVDALFGVLDPSKEGHDYTAIAIGWITDGVLTVYGKLWKESWGDCEDKIVQIAKNLRCLWVETNIVGSTLTNILINQGIYAESFTTTKNKTEKILGLRGLINSGRLMFYHKMGEEERAQLYNWTAAAEYDDLPDAVAMLADFMGCLISRGVD